MVTNLYSLKKGDMFANSRWAAILTRKTRKYWYFRWVHNPQEGRVRISRLWKHIDAGKLTLHYHSSMKYRRKKKDGRTIFLEVDSNEANLERLKDFMGFARPPFFVNFQRFHNNGQDMSGEIKKEIITFLKKANLKCYNVDCQNDTFLAVEEGRFEVKVEESNL